MDTSPSRSPEKVQSPLLALGFLFLLTLGISIVPASWLGVRQQVARYAPIDLSKLGESLAESDTDGNGTLSWNEFISNSLDITPNEAATPIEVDEAELATLNDPNNLTSSFSKNLYITSVALKGQGISDPLSEQETISQLVEKEAEKIIPTSYSIQELNLTSTESTNIKKAYGNKVATQLAKTVTEESMTLELTSFVTFMQNGEEGELTPLIRRVSELDLVLDELLSMSVPSSASQVHILALNRIATFRNTLENLSKAPYDPMRAALSLKTYQSEAIDVLRLYLEYAAYFEKNNLAFSSQEAGFEFVKRYTNK